MSRFRFSQHEEPDRFLPPAHRPREIACFCARLVDADELVICQRCARLMCSNCSKEFELEARCCAACIVGYCNALSRERHQARLKAQVFQEERLAEYRSRRLWFNIASVQVIVIAGLVIFIFCMWRW